MCCPTPHFTTKFVCVRKHEKILSRTLTLNNWWSFLVSRKSLPSPQRVTDYCSCWLSWAHLIHLLAPAMRTTVEFEKRQAEQLSGKSLGSIPKQSPILSSPGQPQIGSTWSACVSDPCKRQRIADRSEGQRWHLGSGRSWVGLTANNDTSLFTFQAFGTKHCLPSLTHLSLRLQMRDAKGNWLCVKNSAQSCGLQSSCGVAKACEAAAWAWADDVI